MRAPKPGKSMFVTYIWLQLQLFCISLNYFFQEWIVFFRAVDEKKFLLFPSISMLELSLIPSPSYPASVQIAVPFSFPKSLTKPCLSSPALLAAKLVYPGHPWRVWYDGDRNQSYFSFSSTLDVHIAQHSHHSLPLTKLSSIFSIPHVLVLESSVPSFNLCLLSV